VKAAAERMGHVEYKQPFSLFDVKGGKITSTQGLLQAREVFLIEGGQWVWPGVTMGHEHRTSSGQILKTVSLQPLVFSIEDFVRPAVTKHIRKLHEPHLRQWPKPKSGIEFIHRTSLQARLEMNATGPFKLVSKKVAQVSNMPEEHLEYASVLKYKVDEYYAGHFDAVPVNKNAVNFQYGHLNRHATVLVYLNNVASGGETMFLRANGLAPPNNLKSCKDGKRIIPIEGKAILFYNLLPNGHLDHTSLHAGCPLKLFGEKWVANYFIWNKPYFVLGKMSTPKPKRDRTEL